VAAGSQVRPGTLYVVATPIGNLGDLTPRAREVIAAVDAVLCEDTRRTGLLLSRVGLEARALRSHHEHNEVALAAGLVAELVDGRSLALVSDAGTPLVSDPGYRLVRACHEASVPVVAVPGASAAIAALSISGLPTDRHVFLGYLPPRAARRRALLEEVRGLRMTLILYEGPHRLRKTLGDLADELGDRPAALCRELTKVHEEVRRDTLSGLAAWAASATVRGELTLVVGGAADDAGDDPEPAFVGRALEMYEALLAEGVDPAEARRKTHEVFG